MEESGPFRPGQNDQSQCSRGQDFPILQTFGLLVSGEAQVPRALDPTILMMQLDIMFSFLPLCLFNTHEFLHPPIGRTSILLLICSLQAKAKITLMKSPVGMSKFNQN